MEFLLGHWGMISGLSSPVIAYFGYKFFEKQIKDALKELIDVIEVVVMLSEVIIEAGKDGKYTKDEIKNISKLIQELIKQLGEFLIKVIIIRKKMKARL